jgi:sulfur carrier protein ThiS
MLAERYVHINVWFSDCMTVSIRSNYINLRIFRREMMVYIQKEAQTLQMEYSGTAGALLEKLKVNPEVVLIVKDGALITPDDDISGAQKIELLSVISGG